MAKKYFLSYGRRQTAWAEAFHRDLSALVGEGSVWFDRIDLPNAQGWSNPAQAALDAADKLILLATPEAMASPCVESEWQAFKTRCEHFARTGRILVVKLAPVELPAFLNVPLSFDLTACRNEDYAGHLRKIAGTLSGSKPPADVLIGPMAAAPATLHEPTRIEFLRTLEPLMAKQANRRSLAAAIDRARTDAFEGHAGSRLAAQAAIVAARGGDDDSTGARKLVECAGRAFGEDEPAAVAALEAACAKLPPVGDARDAMAAWRKLQVDRHSRLSPFMDAMASQAMSKVCVDVAVSGHRSADREVLRRAVEGRDRAGLAELMRAEDSERAPRWTVRGMPGAGKSTMARNLCRQLAESADGTVPVYVPLVRWSETDAHPYSFAEDELRAADLKNGARFSERLRAVSNAHNEVWVFFDGLDEIAPELIESTSVRIARFAEEFPKVSIAVLGRPVAFERRSLGEDFQEARVEPLGPREQRDLLGRYLAAAVVERVAAEIARSPALAQLSENPLLLTLVAVIAREAHEDGRPLPNRRDDIYDRAATVLLERGYSPERGFPSPAGRKPVVRGIADVSAARDVLKPLSVELHRLGGESWKDEVVFRQLGQVRMTDPYVDHLIDKTKAWAGRPRDFLNDLDLNGGVFGRLDGKTEDWRFLHRSFREYFVACALADRHQKDGDAALEPFLGPIETAIAKRKEWEVLRRKKDPQSMAAKDPVEVFASRWGEVFGMVAVRRGDDSKLLERVGALSGEVLVRILPQAEGLDPARGLDLFLGAENYDFRFEQLEKLVASWGLEQRRISDVLAAKLPRVAKIGVIARRIEVASFFDLLMHPDRRSPLAPDFFATVGLPQPPDAAQRLNFVAIPSGSFAMGSGKYEAERPVRTVRIENFSLAATPVTIREYGRFDSDWVAGDGDADKPVTEISWWAARLYARWVGGRLPSEAEWEYACRAGTTTEYWPGNSEADVARVGWIGENSEGRLHAVGEKPANAYGLFDMHGNVWEWCEDRWHANYEGAPVDGRSWTEGPSGNRVIRGGSDCYPAEYARSACRDYGVASVRNGFVGFRPAKSVTP